MEGFKLLKVDEDQSCKICGVCPRRYTCPRCGVAYCTVNCYRSLAHSECSESFYKQCVEEEFKVREQDSEAERKMLDILKRMHDQAWDESVSEDIMDTNQSMENSVQPDSDDEEEVPDLAERLENVNLDDADAVWSALTDTERQEFEALVRNGEKEKLLPPWIPWWSCRVEKKFVQELDEDRQDFDYVKNCPRIMEVPTSIDVSAASPCIRFNLSNILHAYAYVVLYYGGDHHDFAREATNIFLQLCDNMRHNENFQDSITSIQSVVQRAIDCQWLPTDEQTLLRLKAAGNLIARGPEETNCCFYISAALSDLHRLFASIKRERSAPKSSAKSEKLEYYLAWIKNHDGSICG